MYNLHAECVCVWKVGYSRTAGTLGQGSVPERSDRALSAEIRREQVCHLSQLAFTEYYNQKTRRASQIRRAEISEFAVTLLRLQCIPKLPLHKTCQSWGSSVAKSEIRQNFAKHTAYTSLTQTGPGARGG